MKRIYTVQHTQSEHHTNEMVLFICFLISLTFMHSMI